MTAHDFWGDQVNSQKVVRTLAGLKDGVSSINRLSRDLEDLEVLLVLGEEEDDEPVAAELQKGLRSLQERVEEAELQLMLSGPHDRNNAILALHAGAGGTEAQDWVEMLVRMFSRWSEQHGYHLEVMDMLPGDEAGTKSATLLVSGPYAFGYLKAEKGVHRLVRISPFDAAGRRHTSFASVDVLPEVEDDAEVAINTDDLKIDTYRSGGAGGQHVNKTDSAVRITHLPTGVVAQCQSERSQISNRAAAMKLLKAKLLDLEQRKKDQELAAMRDDQQDIAWGSQIRSYVFHPYSLVKDHRTGVEIGNVNAVMDGELDPFITAYLQHIARR